MTMSEKELKLAHRYANGGEDRAKALDELLVLHGEPLKKGIVGLMGNSLKTSMDVEEVYHELVVVLLDPDTPYQVTPTPWFFWAKQVARRVACQCGRKHSTSSHGVSLTENGIKRLEDKCLCPSVLSALVQLVSTQSTSKHQFFRKLKQKVIAAGRVEKLTELEEATISDCLHFTSRDSALPEAEKERTSIIDLRLSSDLCTALESLHTKDREILNLRFHGHLTFEDIAEVLGCPVRTARTRYYRAINRLREQLNEYAPGKQF